MKTKSLGKMEGDPQVKVVILGNPDVGKSSILQRYLTGAYSEDSTSTLGAKFMGKRVCYKGKFLKLNIWDTAGQERYESFSKIYCRNARAVLLVYDHSCPESLLGMEKWYQIMSTEVFPGDALIFVVGNKVDKDRFTSALDSQVKAFGDSILAEFFNVSAKTGEGIEELFMRITAKIMDKATKAKANRSSVVLDHVQHEKKKQKKRVFC